MANHQDFLLVIDEHLQESALGYVPGVEGLWALARDMRVEHPAAARWMGELVKNGWVRHGEVSMGDRRPWPPGGMWTDDDLQRVGDYTLTDTGHAHADRLRRQRRESLTDAVLGLHVPTAAGATVAEPAREALAQPLQSLRSALDEGRHAAAIGAAKDLAEAACKVAIERAGGELRASEDLPKLFRRTRDHAIAQHPDEEKIGRSLGAVVDGLARLRNDLGAGHGRSAGSDASARQARLAASAGVAIAVYLLAERSAAPAS